MADFKLLLTLSVPILAESVDMVEAVDYESKSSADFPYFKKVFHSPDANWIALCDDENDNAKLFKSLPGYQLHQQDHGTWLMETDKQEMVCNLIHVTKHAKYYYLEVIFTGLLRSVTEYDCVDY